MAPRAHWRGFLKLSFVSCPVALYPAIATEERLSFRRVNRRTGNRLRQRLVDEVTGEPVQSDESGRGYQVGKHQYQIVEDADLRSAEEEARDRPFLASHPTSEPPAADISSSASRLEPRQSSAPSSAPVRSQRTPRLAVHETDEEVVPEPKVPTSQPARIENNRTIEIDQFVPSAQLDPAYFQTPYYIAPRGEIGEEAFAVIRDAMRSKTVVAMGRIVLARRERPLIIEPLGRGLRGTTLRFAHEIRDAADYFATIAEVQLPDDMLRIAEHIVELMTSGFDKAYLEDRYRTVVLSKLRQKHAESPQKPSSLAPSSKNIINLMDALKRSLSTEKMPQKPSASQRGPKTSRTARNRIR